MRDSVRDSLHKYMAVVMHDRGYPAILINSVADHVHVLFDLGRSASISEVVEATKRTSSMWIKKQGKQFAGFAWQAGYAAFAVSHSNLGRVRNYIANQKEHHRGRSFQDEYRAFLRRHQVEFDERYVWD